MALHVRWLGRVPYRDAWALQRGLYAWSRDDHLLLLEHPHVYTLGVRADERHVLVSPGSVGAELVRTDRGGDVTYHGPGQLVGYPILSLPPKGGGTRTGMADTVAYVRSVEQLVIDALADVGLPGAGRLERYPGVWVDPGGDDPRKIAAIGVRLTRGRTMHGFALNVEPDMRYWGYIVPCGIPDKRVTSLAEEGVRATMREVVDAVAERAAALWGKGEVVRQDVVWRHTPSDLSAFSRGEGPGEPVPVGGGPRPTARPTEAGSAGAAGGSRSDAAGSGSGAAGGSGSDAAGSGSGAAGGSGSGAAGGVGAGADAAGGSRSDAAGSGSGAAGGSGSGAAGGSGSGAAGSGSGAAGGVGAEGAGVGSGAAGGVGAAGAAGGGVPVRLRGRLAQAGVTEGLRISARKPDWLRSRFRTAPGYLRLKATMRDLGLATVCEEAGCPNIFECWADGTATFMINGERCTRACGFCLVDTRHPLSLDPDEPERVAEAVERMGLGFAVVTAVARDDLPDGGAGAFAATIEAIHRRTPGVQVEVLIPDCKGDEAALETIFAARPEVLNHNIETVPRLQRAVRPSAGYARSLAVLARAKEAGLVTKSGLIVGMGETDDEVLATLADLRAVGVDIVTIGQYLRPTTHHLPVARWVEPATFDAYRRAGEALGISHVEASPLTRSSYHARQAAGSATGTHTPAPGGGPSIIENKRLLG